MSRYIFGDHETFQKHEAPNTIVITFPQRLFERLLFFTWEFQIQSKSNCFDCQGRSYSRMAYYTLVKGYFNSERAYISSLIKHKTHSTLAPLIYFIIFLQYYRSRWDFREGRGNIKASVYNRNRVWRPLMKINGLIWCFLNLKNITAQLVPLQLTS